MGKAAWDVEEEEEKYKPFMIDALEEFNVI